MIEEPDLASGVLRRWRERDGAALCNFNGVLTIELLPCFYSSYCIAGV
jgi:hypothetical protein